MTPSNPLSTAASEGSSSLSTPTMSTHIEPLGPQPYRTLNPNLKETWWCNAHQRPATHITRNGDHCCAPNLAGTLAVCYCVDLTGIAEVISRPTPGELIETEYQLAALWNAGEIPSLLHLAGSIDGQYEEWLCRYFEENVRPTDWVLASHRCHYHAQLHGMSRETLIAEVLAGKSMFLHQKFPRFLSSAIVAGTCSIAAGIGLAIKNRGGAELCHVFIGDGACDHGHALESIAFVAAKGLPVKFIVESNDSSCGVTRQQRRGSDWEWNWPGCVIPISYTPKWPHAGSGVRPNLKWRPSNE